MKRLLCVLATVAMTMLINSVQAEETPQDWKTSGMPSELSGDVVLTDGPAVVEASSTLDGKGYTVYGGSKNKSGTRTSHPAILFRASNSTLILKDVTFDSCGSDSDGMNNLTISVESVESIDTNKIQLSGAITFSNNGGLNVDYHSGVIYTSKLTTDGLTSLTCTGNRAEEYGGVFYIGNAGTIDISNVTGKVEFANNSAGLTGSAIFATGNVSFKNNTTVTFSGNTANSQPNDIYTAGSNVTIQGGTYSFDGGIVTDASIIGETGKGDITISPYNTDQPDEKATAVTFDCDLTAGTVSITDSTVTFGEVQPALTSNSPSTPQVAAVALASPAIMAASTVLSEPTSDLEIPADLKSTNNQINGTALTLSAEPSTKTRTVTGNLTAENSTINVQDNLAVTGALTTDSDSTININFLQTLTIGDVATLSGTINIGGTGSEVTDQTLLTAGTSLTFTELELNYTGSGNFDLSWDISEDGNSLLYTLKSKSGPEPAGTGVPEPSTWALLILGFAGLMWYRRKK